MEFSKAVLFDLALLGLVGCNRAVSYAPIIDQYNAATCISPSLMPGPNPASREWNAKILLLDGSQVFVTGAQMPGGRIDIRYPKSGENVVAADAGDYIYPSDVRLNPQNDDLYVKASGLGGGIWFETWLFEYDIRAQRLLKRQKVVDKALPTECTAVQ